MSNSNDMSNSFSTKSIQSSKWNGRKLAVIHMFMLYMVSRIQPKFHGFFATDSMVIVILSYHAFTSMMKKMCVCANAEAVGTCSTCHHLTGGKEVIPSHINANYMEIFHILPWTKAKRTTKGAWYVTFLQTMILKVDRCAVALNTVHDYRVSDLSDLTNFLRKQTCFSVKFELLWVYR